MADRVLEYGALMTMFRLPKWNVFIKKFIRAKDLSELPDLGFETEPHCTLLYGFDDSVTVESVKSLLISSNQIKIEFTKIDYFETKEFDVVKFEASSEQLTQLNQKLKQLPHVELYPVYLPHMTIAYLKPGTAKKYCRSITSFTLTPVEYCFSYSTGRREYFDI